MKMGTWADLVGPEAEPDEPDVPPSSSSEDEDERVESDALLRSRPDRGGSAGRDAAGGGGGKSTQNVFLSNREKLKFFRLDAGRGATGGCVAIIVMMLELAVGTLFITPGRCT